MPTKRKLFTTFVLLLLLVGAPVISYLYLKAGYEYRREVVMTRGDYGKMPDLGELTAVRGRFPEKPRGGMVMVGWLDPARPEASERYGRKLDSLFQQFQNSPNLYFTTIVRADDPRAAATAFADRHNLPPDPMLSFLAADPATFSALARDFALPQPAAPARSPSSPSSIAP